MASVTEVLERFQERKGKYNSDGTRTSKRVWRALCDDVNMDDLEVLALAISTEKIPEQWSDHPSDDSLWLETYSIAPFETEQMAWLITGNYVTRTGTSAQTNDRTNDEPVISFGFATYQRPLEQAWDLDNERGYSANTRDIPVVNSAGDPWNPPLANPVANMVIIITRNESDSDFDPDNVKSFHQTLNSNPISIAGVKLEEGEGLLRSFEPQKRIDTDNLVYWEVRYEIEVDRVFKHNKIILDQGFYHITGNEGTRQKVAITEADISEDGSGSSNVVTEPQKLDGNGCIVSWTDESEGYYLEFRVFEAKNWGTLGLPANK